MGRVWRFVDVTEQRQLQQRLQESQKMESIGHLAGGIAHDFNNLLTAIRGNLSLAELEPNSDATRSKIDDANRAAGRATELVQQILGYSRKTSGLRRTTDISQTINNVRTILRASLDPKVNLRINVSTDTWAASADPMQIEQVLLNLCINARDVLPSDQGEISITTTNISGLRATDAHALPESEGDFVVIRVRDNGSGIKPEHRAHIFEPFFTTKAEGKGTGLGLAMAKNIIEQAGGRIAFESQVGKGTEFSIYLPRSTAKVEPKPVEAPRPVATTRGMAEGTVLVVDDEAPVRAIAVNMLKYLGYRVLEACDGEQAIHVLQTSERAIDAVMMDVYMPKLSGRETYQRMRSLGIDLPVIVCSGFMVEPDEFIALAQGRNASVQVIQKPYSMETLARVVAKAIAKGHHALTA
jgi:two-component system cell cycle sensor histidine kinase/response regulator CckA